MPTDMAKHKSKTKGVQNNMPPGLARLEVYEIPQLIRFLGIGFGYGSK